MHSGLLEPILFPPLCFVLGEIKFLGKPLSMSECRTETPLAAAALTPWLLKDGKKVDINHLKIKNHAQQVDNEYFVGTQNLTSR